MLIHPCPDDTYRIDWQVPPDFDLSAEEAERRAGRRIRQVIGEHPYELVWRSVYRFQSRIADRMQVGRVLLAGDAAHLFSPFGARGLNSGVCDVENAAWKIAYVRRGWAGEALLDSYPPSGWRRRPRIWRSPLRRCGSSSPARTPSGSTGPTCSRAPCAEPAARRLVDSGRLCEPFWYVDSPIVVPDPSRPFAGRPERGDVPVPAPGILVPDCPIARSRPVRVDRLRQLARGGGLTVLLGDEAAVPAHLAGCPADVAVRRMRELDPELAEMLGARPDELWLLRPDAYVAAIVTSEAALHAAIRAAVAAPLAVVGAALVRDGMVLAAHRPGRGWEFPGGKVEPGEAPADALVRECREELDVQVVAQRALGTRRGRRHRTATLARPAGRAGADREHRPRRVALARRGRSRQRRLAAGRRAVARGCPAVVTVGLMEIVVRGHRPPGRRFDTHTNVHVGLQVRSQPSGLVPADTPDAEWTADVQVVPCGGGVDYRGPAVHGRAGERFLYLTWGEVADDRFEMFRRAKLMLDDSGADESTARVVADVELSDEQRRPAVRASAPARGAVECAEHLGASRTMTR